MKKIILALMILVPVGLAAQSKSFNDFYDKYEGEEGFSCVSLAGDMLGNAYDSAFPHVGTAEDVVKDITSVKIVITGKASRKFLRDLNKMVRKGNYKTVLSINKDNDKIVTAYVSKKDFGKGEEKQKEILMIITHSEGKNAALSVTGKGDLMKMIGNLDGLNI